MRVIYCCLLLVLALASASVRADTDHPADTRINLDI